jgi:large subunit ribosomal protein L18
MPTKGARVFAVAKGAIDAGLKLPINEEVIPDEKRIKGYHIIEYYNMIKNDESKKVFLSTYRSNESNIEKLPDIISGIINKINTDI